MHVLIGTIPKCAQVISSLLDQFTETYGGIPIPTFQLVHPVLTDSRHLSDSAASFISEPDVRFFERLVQNGAIFDLRKEGKGQVGFVKEHIEILSDEELQNTVVFGATPKAVEELGSAGANPFIITFDNAPEDVRTQAHLVLPHRRYADAASQFMGWLMVTYVMQKLGNREAVIEWLKEVRSEPAVEMNTPEERDFLNGMLDTAFEHLYPAA